MIVVENLSLELRQTQILKDISYEFKNHQFYGIMGASGSGKSSFLKSLIGWYHPTKGKVLWDQVRAQDLSDDERARKFGYVIQDGGLYPHLSAENNISLAGRVRDFKAEELRHRISELCHLFRFSEENLKSYPHELSGGQRQRVAFMRALFLNPPYLFLDETFSSLDPILKHELYPELQMIFQKLNITVFLISHDPKEIFYFADEILFFQSGQLIYSNQKSQFVEKCTIPSIQVFMSY
jgi:osmoprotectant transport system ATP-binding protein